VDSALFDYLSKGTVAQGAKLKIERTPIMVQCDALFQFLMNRGGKLGDLVCPACGGRGGTLLSGREYYIKEMEVAVVENIRLIEVKEEILADNINKRQRFGNACARQKQCLSTSCLHRFR